MLGLASLQKRVSEVLTEGNLLLQSHLDKQEAAVIKQQAELISQRWEICR